MKALAIVFFIIFSNLVQAQDLISTDRPDQSEGVFTMPKGRLQLENGLTIRSKNLTSETFLRYGVGKVPKYD